MLTITPYRIRCYFRTNSHFPVVSKRLLGQWAIALVIQLNLLACWQSRDYKALPITCLKYPVLSSILTELIAKIISNPAKEISICNIFGCNYGQIQQAKFSKCNDSMMGMVLVTVIGLRESIHTGLICRNGVDLFKTIDWKILYLSNLFTENFKRLFVKRCVCDIPTKRSPPNKLQSFLTEVPKKLVCRTLLPKIPLQGYLNLL